MRPIYFQDNNNVFGAPFKRNKAAHVVNKGRNIIEEPVGGIDEGTDEESFEEELETDDESGDNELMEITSIDSRDIEKRPLTEVVDEVEGIVDTLTDMVTELDAENPSKKKIKKNTSSSSSFSHEVLGQKSTSMTARVLDPNTGKPLRIDESMMVRKVNSNDSEDSKLAAQHVVDHEGNMYYYGVNWNAVRARFDNTNLSETSSGPSSGMTTHLERMQSKFNTRMKRLDTLLEYYDILMNDLATDQDIKEKEKVRPQLLEHLQNAQMYCFSFLTQLRKTRAFLLNKVNKNMDETMDDPDKFLSESSVADKESKAEMHRLEKKFLELRKYVKKAKYLATADATIKKTKGKATVIEDTPAYVPFLNIPIRHPDAHPEQCQKMCLNNGAFGKCCVNYVCPTNEMKRETRGAWVAYRHNATMDFYQGDLIDLAYDFYNWRHNLTPA